MGKVLIRFHSGKATLEDSEWINEHVVTIHTTLPTDIKYATYFNRDHDAINTALFEERCAKICIVRRATLQTQ